MDKQTIQELEIIIKAQVENARKDMKKVAKDTKNAVSSMSKDINFLNNSGALDNFNSQIKDGINELKSFDNELRKIKITDNGLSFEVKADFSDYQEQIEKAQKEYEQLHSYIANDPLTPSSDNTNTNSKINLDGSQAKQEIKNIEQETYSLQERLKDFDLLTLKEEIRTVGMQFSQLTPQFSQVVSLFNNIGKIAKNSFSQVKTEIKESANTVGTPLNKLKNLINKIKEIKVASKEAKQSSNGIGSSLSKSLSSGIKSIKNFALSLLSIRTAFTAISKACQSYLSFDAQLQSSIQNSWNVLGSLLAPILEYVASLFNKLVSSVATFVKTLTGIDLVAKANTKSLNKQTKAASNTAKALSGIDDIDTLSSGNGGGGGETPEQIKIDDVDIGPLEAVFEKIKEIFITLFEPLKSAWESVGQGVFQSLIDMIMSIKELCSTAFDSFAEVWGNGTGEEIFTNILLGWQQIFDIIGAVSEALTNAWTNAGSGTSIIQHICDIFKDIQNFGLSIGETLKKWVMSESFQTALNYIFKILDDIFKIIEDIVNWCVKMYDQYLKPVIEDKLLPAIDEIITCIGEIWVVAKPVIDKIIEAIKKYLEPVIAGVTKVIGGIIDVIKGIIQFITGVFTGNWKKAWEGVKNILSGVWNTIKGVVSTVWNAIWGVIKGVINTIIKGMESMVNTVIRGLNAILTPLRKVGNAILKAVGIDSFSFEEIKKVSLPRLATGNVAYEPVVAQIGEYANAKSNPEIVSPVSMMKDSFRAVLNEFDFGGTRVDTLKIDVAGKNFYDDTIDYINDKTERNGVSVIKEA